MRQLIEKNYLFLLFLAALTVTSFWISQFSPATPSFHFVDLASAFLKGQLHLNEPIRDSVGDTSLFQGKYYVYFSPLPAILLMPFVALFGRNFPQQSLIPFIAIGTFIVIYKICRHLHLKSSDPFWLSIFFIFGTVYLFLTLNPISAYYVQVFGLFFIFLALFEFTGKKRPLLIGFYLGLAGLTRTIYYLTVVFFLIEFLIQKGSIYKKISQIGLVSLVAIIFFTLNGFYNYVRFQNPLETGYSFQTNTNPIYLEAKKEGVFSLKHIPGNLYFLLFKGPDPVREDNLTYILKPPYLRVNEWGLGILFTSPLFIYLILAKLKDRHVFPSLITTFFMSIPVLTYYGIGLWQYGYRYALDFYPFLFLILLSIFKDGLPLKAKILIIYGIIFNFFFMFSIWNLYPFKF